MLSNDYSGIDFPVEEPQDSNVSPFPGNAWETGNTVPDPLFPVSRPPVWETGNTATRPAFVDVAALLDGTMPPPPEPTILARTDGVSLFYAGQVSLVFGDPESGKTWVCLAAAAESLNLGRRVLVIDLDHNGPEATVSRLVDLGAAPSALSDPERFLYIEPDDGADVLAVVRYAVPWSPDLVVLDSLGELVPLFGGSSNSPDDFTRVHSTVMKPLARSGAAVLCIDHLAKNSESRAMGSTGTAAKKRAIGGVSLRVNVAEQFAPGRGGSAHLTIAKDRHGGLRRHCPTGDKEPLAGTFKLYADNGWSLIAPAASDRNPAEAPAAADVDALQALDPPPSSVRDVAKRMQWKTARAADALRAFRMLPEAAFPVSHTEGGQQGNTVCDVCHEPIDPVAGTTHPGCS